MKLADDTALTVEEIQQCVAELADRILGLTEDPGEHERIVNELGDVLENWNNGYPLTAHPYNRGVEPVQLTEAGTRSASGGALQY